jgi:catalase
VDLLARAGIPSELPSGDVDPGLLHYDPESIGDAINAFIVALGQHRHFARETDPPVI